MVEVIKSLSTDEKREIQLLLQQYLREERRDEIHNNFKSAQVEQQKGVNQAAGVDAKVIYSRSTETLATQALAHVQHERN
ncbi:MAG: hypothetical protein HC769_30805 [Cyanobacteria bacterium CRU_2_1]|nr:hypothetical protein [Cyanobacteria bacterium CRU_2_1]